MTDSSSGVSQMMEQPKTYLRVKLCAIHQSLENNTVPSAEAIDDLRKAFAFYFSYCKNSDKPLVLTDVLSEEAIDHLVTWVEHVPAENDDLFFDDSFLQDKGNLEILKRLVQEKIVASPEGVFKEFIDYLIAFGYVASVKVQEEDYLLLTASGWDWITLDYTQEILLSEDPAFVIPAKLVANVANWGNTELFSLVQLRKYYKKLGIDKFMVYEEAAMVWGCEIQDTYAPRYCVPFLHSQAQVEQEVLRIIELCLSGQVESITLLVQSPATQKNIEALSGVDEMPSHLHFSFMIEGDEP